MVKHCDIIIVGGGIAGLRAALTASKSAKVILLLKGKIGEGATEKAQGGIAAAIDSIKDSTQYHLEDTLEAGAGLCNEEAVKILVNEGVARVKELIEMGARFDKAETEAGGGFALALEGAHKRRRILHAGDATGLEIEKTLGNNLIKEGLAEIHEETPGIDLIIKDSRCIGINAQNLKTGEIETYLANAVILATGGLCQIFLYTTNPLSATGDGVAMAYRAGAEVTDMEFVQFHPTALVQFKEFEDIIALPQFLISEAVRGEGGILLNKLGERFMEKYHSKLELAPRDVVSRAIFTEMQSTGSDHVYLSLQNIEPENIKKRFPVIYKTCLERGLDITKDNIPVAPAAHYAMGGIKTDVKGQTNISGLFAAGECASLGVHGANRLASNSLLDGLVFGQRSALAAKKMPSSQTIEFDQEKTSPTPHLKDVELQRLKLIIKSAIWKGAGIIRSKNSLIEALRKIEIAEKQLNFMISAFKEIEVMNMLTVSKLIIQAALDRQESRGAHYRSDFPEKDDVIWKKNLVYKNTP